MTGFGFLNKDWNDDENHVGVMNTNDDHDVYDYVDVGVDNASNLGRVLVREGAGLGSALIAPFL